eukprot:3339010-Pyramimonas_sp.AAC.1
MPTWASPLEPVCPPAAPADEDGPDHQQTVYPSTVDRPTTWHCNLVLHLFSGHRRPNDIQDHLEKLAAEWSVPLMVLSLDVQNNADRGGMTKKENL